MLLFLLSLFYYFTIQKSWPMSHLGHIIFSYFTQLSFPFSTSYHRWPDIQKTFHYVIFLMCIVQAQCLYCSIHSKIHIHVTAHNILETAITVCQINNAHFKDGLYVGWISCIFMRQIFPLFFRKGKHTKKMNMQKNMLR